MAMVLGVDVVVCWVCDMIVWSRLFCGLWFFCVGCVTTCVVLRQASADLCCWYIQLG